jgi:methionine--tRNA ligase beta chain
MEEIIPVPIKPSVSFDILDKIDIRVGTIEEVKDVEKSDKLIRMRVNFGDHTRTIFSGMKKERKDCQDLVGKQTLFVVNLEPKKMMGEVSEGMIFDIGYADHIVPALAVPERPVPNGTRLG